MTTDLDPVIRVMRAADAIVLDGHVVRKGTSLYDATWIERVNERTYRTHVHADNYPHQTYLKAEVWLEARGWTEVFRRDGHELAIATPNAKGPKSAEHTVPTQLRAAVAIAREIVEGHL